MKKTLTLMIFVLALNLWANYVDTYAFGKRMFDDGLYEEAIREFDSVIKQAPTSPEAEYAIFLGL